jgi:hypothetical protein
VIAVFAVFDDAVAAVREWDRRRWTVALITSVATLVVIALPTALLPNPVFGREIGPTWWSWPVLVVSSVLSGLLLATYVRGADDTLDREGRTGLAGGFLAFLAVGCPVCNKLALVALGYAGAIRWFAPVQPVLAAGAIALLAWALSRRLAGQVRCPVPTREPADLPH